MQSNSVESFSEVNKPWTRWWWHGNVVTEQGITTELQKLKNAGIGGVELTPIYGVIGESSKFINYLSPRWVELLNHTIREANRMGLGVDMATGTGWPFGGPMVEEKDAAKYMVTKNYTLQSGQKLKEKIFLVEDGFVRSIDNMLLDKRKRPLTKDDILRPIKLNEDLQSMAIDQVRFGDTLQLDLLMAYSNQGDTLDLSKLVNKQGELNWTAPKGNWKLFAVFSGNHGKMVERAAPGGEGLVIDHFADESIDNYLKFIGDKLGNTRGLRAFFNDSYEVDDAKGQSNYTGNIWGEFAKRRGYKLQNYLEAFSNSDHPDYNLILSDYRETVSDLMLDNFTTHWANWASMRGSKTRNQAHGSPANILDLYARCDIPETEGTEMMRIRFASSAGHTQGKSLISAESITWLNEHFLSNLADVKQNVDRYFIGGVNHIFYHGTSYSPEEDAWPGRVFYAAVHVNDRNPLWKHWPQLNAYIARSQAVLQAGKPSNDVLVYYPFHDWISEPKNNVLRHVDGYGKDADSTAFGQMMETLQRNGLAFDFISDRQIANLTTDESGSILSNGLKYKALVVPQSKFMDQSTLQVITQLAEKKGQIVFENNLPLMAPGMMSKEINGFNNLTQKARSSGKVLIQKDIILALKNMAVVGEELSGSGISFIKRRISGNMVYFLNNASGKPIDVEVALNDVQEIVNCLDPMSDINGLLESIKSSDGKMKYRIQMSPGQSLILQKAGEQNKNAWIYSEKDFTIKTLENSWKVHFNEGGPILPKDTTIAKISDWTSFGGSDFANFSGCATYYSTFQMDATWPEQVLLELGKVHETANVSINGKLKATLIGPDFSVWLSKLELQKSNVIEIEVCNLMANRISFMDKTNLPWKRFYNVNVAARLIENRNQLGIFDASHWSTTPSGITGPVTIRYSPLK